MNRILRRSGAFALVVAGLPIAVPALQAQQRGEISFETDLPRVLVFIQERDGQIAAQEMTSFFLEAGFPIVDPALAYTSAQR